MVNPEPVKLLELAIKNGDAKAAAAKANDNPSLLTYQKYSALGFTLPQNVGWFVPSEEVSSFKTWPTTK